MDRGGVSAPPLASTPQRALTMNLVPINSIIVVRGGKRVTPEIGKAFDFTDDEAKHLLAQGVARLANSADPNGDAVAAPTGEQALAAGRSNVMNPADIARAAAEGVAAALKGEAPPAAKPAKAKASKAEDGDDL